MSKNPDGCHLKYSYLFELHSVQLKRRLVKLPTKILLLPKLSNNISPEGSEHLFLQMPFPSIHAPPPPPSTHTRVLLIQELLKSGDCPLCSAFALSLFYFFLRVIFKVGHTHVRTHHTHTHTHTHTHNAECAANLIIWYSLLFLEVLRWMREILLGIFKPV